MELQPGQAVAGYEVVRPLKAGGMASLYLARRRGAAGFQRPVAIKVVHAHLARDRKFIRMFLDEARLAVRIDHPNVVRVEELAEVQGTYLMVMEYVHGVALFDLVRALAKSARRLSAEVATWIAVQIAEGLHAAHETRGDDGQLLDVVHRDVSPQNVLLSFAGHVKVIDFGIAKSRAQAERTRVGVIRGKIGYMSPEQANAQPLDRRSDVYALGVVLWEMLTSRRLFRAKSEVALLDLVRNPRVPRPGMFGGGVPEALEDVVMRALEPDASQRIPTAKAFRDALLAAVPGAASVHSSTLAHLISTVMPEKIAEAPVAWDEAGLSGEPARGSTSFLADLTMAASEASFPSEESEEELELPPGPLPSRASTRPPPPPPRGPSAPPPPSPAAPSRPPGPAPRNTFAEFAEPPPTPEEAARRRAAEKEPPAPPSRVAGFFVNLFAFAILFAALAVAGVLLHRGGVLDLSFTGIEALGPFPGDPVEVDMGYPDAGPVDAAFGRGDGVSPP
ncbi:MAG TPA: serine/threonine-protein kinase [Polyangiaceae bacterium LLY-WYZ-15_(1-7)]|nr:hypothetical protein [Sandaracinus sp.]HJL02918.1 serine/threonine-protein kinase [Polyangiaceae bacterium LLY-WYZ-15_(1-7)]HJL12211.1 serine/threonine-protein kinase [Polyangiaceae bacterium LLY-WYZ-15_(1-7)]HJL24001.1 serine/threonine-protein kinase [Polyangiaceae bacterium LLY-WYZ-15_(1-7)]HJL33852.1 serine/threonine-protein kinase [Polyangiaceae bacterium LLY-WYZ-15_(1-7)]